MADRFLTKIFFQRSSGLSKTFDISHILTNATFAKKWTEIVETLTKNR